MTDKQATQIQPRSLLHEEPRDNSNETISEFFTRTHCATATSTVPSLGDDVRINNSNPASSCWCSWDHFKSLKHIAQIYGAQHSLHAVGGLRGTHDKFWINSGGWLSPLGVDSTLWRLFLCLFYQQLTIPPIQGMQSSCSATGGRDESSPSPGLCFHPSPHQSGHHMYLCIHLPRVFSHWEWRVSRACRHRDKRACSCFPARTSRRTLRAAILIVSKLERTTLKDRTFPSSI